MEFNKAKVFTSLNADMVKVGSSGYFANSLKCLRDTVEREYKPVYSKIDRINPDSYDDRFCNKDGYEYNLFYLVKEPVRKENKNGIQ